jgi:hypothetical protein
MNQKDIDRLEMNMVNFVADFNLDKDCLKHLNQVNKDLLEINLYLDANFENQNNPTAEHLMLIGFWLYRIKSHVLKLTL